MSDLLLVDGERTPHWDAVAGKRRRPDHPAVVAFSRPKIELVWDSLGTVPGELTMLEVGAGNGFFSDGLSELFRLTTLDLSARMLAAGPMRVERKIQADATRLPFQADAFDVVFSSNLLHHLAAPDIAVREMARVAARHVVLIEPNPLNPLMAMFGAVVARERGTFKFTAGYTKRLGSVAGLRLRAFSTQGTVVPNKTPTSAVALLERLDVPNPLGFYHVAAFDV